MITSTRFLLAGIASIALLAGCSGDKKAEGGEDDPALTGALGDEIMVDPELTGQNQGGDGVTAGSTKVELPPEQVPIIQKRAIEMATGMGKIAITATQMLDSMTYNPRPTRAEASDVANAIFDGTDAVMLSGETAAGRYPVEFEIPGASVR